MSQSPEYDQEISLKDFFLTIGRYYREIKKRWMLLGLVILVSAGIGAAMHYLTPKSYPTKLTFMVDDESGGAGGMLSGILGSFGGALKPGQTNLDRVLAISTSRRIMNETLLKKVTVDGKNDFIANHILELYDFASYWKERNRNNLIDYRFSSSDISTFSTSDQLVLKHVYKRIISPKKKSDVIIKTGREVDAGILYFEGRTLSPELTVGFLDSLYNTVQYYHEGRTLEGLRRTFDIVSNKVDSLQKELTQKQYALASVRDRSLNIVRERDRVSAQKLQGEIQTLSYAYAEGVKNRELAALELENQSSKLLVLDRPVLPVSSDHGSIVSKVVKSGVLGFILVLFLFVIQLFYKDIMS